MTQVEIRELAKAAASAYLAGAHITDPKIAVDQFTAAYTYALKKFLNASELAQTNSDVNKPFGTENETKFR